MPVECYHSNQTLEAYLYTMEFSISGQIGVAVLFCRLQQRFATTSSKMNPYKYRNVCERAGICYCICKLREFIKCILTEN
jgi:hypothetical protein